MSDVGNQPEQTVHVYKYLGHPYNSLLLYLTGIEGQLLVSC